jgi:hypothetical protein
VPQAFGADVTSDVRSDRCILQSEFAAIEALLPHKSTLYACCPARVGTGLQATAVHKPLSKRLFTNTLDE